MTDVNKIYGFPAWDVLSIAPGNLLYVTSAGMPSLKRQSDLEGLLFYRCFLMSFFRLFRAFVNETFRMAFFYRNTRRRRSCSSIVSSVHIFRALLTERRIGFRFNLSGTKLEIEILCVPYSLSVCGKLYRAINPRISANIKIRYPVIFFLFQSEMDILVDFIQCVQCNMDGSLYHANDIATVMSIK